MLNPFIENNLNIRTEILTNNPSNTKNSIKYLFYFTF
jgi:hypothetical protein